jgi:hypothetical protein
MTKNLKVLSSAAAISALAVSILATAASAQSVRGSVYGPYYNPHTMNNGTGTVSDSQRDPHNDR